MGNNYPVWSEDFIAISYVIDFEHNLEDEHGPVICKKYDEDPEKIANYVPRKSTKIIYVYPDPDSEEILENGQRRITSKLFI